MTAGLRLGRAAVETQTTELDISGTRRPVVIVRSARRRRTISLTVRDGRVRVLAPAHASSAQILDFVVRRSAWITARLEQSEDAAPQRFDDGACLLLHGEAVALCIRKAQGRRASVELAGHELTVHDPGLTTAGTISPPGLAALVRWLRKEADRFLLELARNVELTTGLHPTRVLVRDQKRRWGSCGPDGTIRLNWRLVMAPPALAEYVVLHEFMHLREKNHQAPFWAAVKEFMPEHRRLRFELNVFGRAMPQFE